MYWDNNSMFRFVKCNRRNWLTKNICYLLGSMPQKFRAAENTHYTVIPKQLTHTKPSFCLKSLNTLKVNKI